MARRHNHRSQVITSFVRIKAELEGGKVRCNGCSKVVSLTPNGHLRGHKTPAGEPCAYKATYATRPEIDLPPVVFRGKAPGPVVENERRHPQGQGLNHESRLEAGSTCEDCGRWLPGERHVCGKCANARAAAKRGKPKSA